MSGSEEYRQAAAGYAARAAAGEPLQLRYALQHLARAYARYAEEARAEERRAARERQRAEQPTLW